MRRVLHYWYLLVKLVTLAILVYIAISSPLQAGCGTTYDNYGNVVGCTLSTADGCIGCRANIDYCYCTGHVATPIPTVKPTATLAPIATLAPTLPPVISCSNPPFGQTGTDYCKSRCPASCASCTGLCISGNCSFTCGSVAGCPGGNYYACGPCDSAGYCTRICTSNPQNIIIVACGSPIPTGPTGTGNGGGATNTPPPATRTPTPSHTPVPTPTTGAGPWIKVKDSSFVSVNPLFDSIPLNPVVYDSSDTTQAYFLIGASGVGLASDINVTNLNTNAKVNSPNWQNIYEASNYSMTPANFIAYIKARKEFKEITATDQIDSDGIYLYKGTDPLTLATVPGEFNQYDVVLVSAGTINVNMANFNPTKSIALIADNINFAATTTAAKGIFITSTLTTGTAANQGLKIDGNFAAQTSLVNNRKWTDPKKPSLFVTFNPSIYLDLLPYLSVANYEWRQLQ